MATDVQPTPRTVYATNNWKGHINLDTLGCSYFFLLEDEDATQLDVKFLMKKSQAAPAVEDYIQKANTLTEPKSTIISYVDASEFTGGEIPKTYSRMVIQQNIQSVIEMAHTLLRRGLAICFQAESASTATLGYGTKTPEELWLGKQPSVKHIGVFGCNTFTLIPSEKDQEEAGTSAPTSLQWEGAVEPQIGSMLQKVIFPLATLPEGKKALGSKEVYRTNTGPKWQVTGHKAWMYPPCLVKENYEAHQIDVHKAYVNTDLCEENYMELSVHAIKVLGPFAWGTMAKSMAVYGLCKGGKALTICLSYFHVNNIKFEHKPGSDSLCDFYKVTFVHDDDVVINTDSMKNVNANKEALSV
ncbi:hypothetical protein BDK51DRAFT_42457 [Blyttiomyces helicus]|uniref:Reverse transcriptase Ty1/copia-type domain-containing protein n=1 Tax=Blyttiomyces helicus TaxID=388810 RepID=A0A4P9WS66_9FUNG|nr:hypothetical protein BDK51DRAFT_42457 [Blyttiomyces helicus]|eukprot:RKO94140.1 hypothetical protein BDK51DRAFT_42457 [Blyttiomyces helicus]